MYPRFIGGPLGLEMLWTLCTCAPRSYNRVRSHPPGVRFWIWRVHLENVGIFMSQIAKDMRQGGVSKKPGPPRILLKWVILVRDSWFWGTCFKVLRHMWILILQNPQLNGSCQSLLSSDRDDKKHFLCERWSRHLSGHWAGVLNQCHGIGWHLDIDVVDTFFQGRCFPFGTIWKFQAALTGACWSFFLSTDSYTLRLSPTPRFHCSPGRSHWLQTRWLRFWDGHLFSIRLADDTHGRFFF